MKLYTEYHLKEVYFKGLDNGKNHIEGKCHDAIDSQTPIELPSDKEIYELINIIPFSKHIGDESFNYGQRKGFELGIKYIRHQILNQNK